MKILALLMIANFFIDGSQSKSTRPEELDSAFWHGVGQQTLKRFLSSPPNENVAKNVIFFLGDGMSVNTVTAARIYDGQIKKKSGEENFLRFEKFPNVALVKTYNLDKQVSDSASTATAFFTGVKGNHKTIGVNGRVAFDDCEASMKDANQVPAIAKWAQQAGKDTGFVTTTRVTHATPAGLYSFTANRDWESDGIMPQDKRACPDIANQLVLGKTGKHFKVILGGGKKHFIPASLNGTRLNGNNLIDVWLASKRNQSKVAKFVETKQQLSDINIDSTDYLLGMFNDDHLEYEIQKTGTEEPTIVDMTEKAIKMLQKSKNGFYLMVEGGKIDWAHHAGTAKLALSETVFFNKAIEKAVQMTNSDDTLIVVTADHSHTMTINGYPERGNDILGVTNAKLTDTFPNFEYTTLMYTNGPGFRLPNSTGSDILPVNITGFDTLTDDYHQVAAVPVKYETHGGDDVAIYANGPMAHLFRGVIEQNYIPHAIAYAGCYKNKFPNKCDSSSGPWVVQSNVLVIFSIIIALISKSSH